MAGGANDGNGGNGNGGNLLPVVGGGDGCSANEPCAICGLNAADAEDEGARLWVKCDDCFLWHHFACLEVGLLSAGHWFCPSCLTFE